MENWLKEHRSILMNFYMIIIIIILVVFTIFVIKNVNHIKYSPCEACIKMGYPCSTNKLSNIDIDSSQAWEEVIKENEKEVDYYSSDINIEVD